MYGTHIGASLTRTPQPLFEPVGSQSTVVKDKSSHQYRQKVVPQREVGNRKALITAWSLGSTWWGAGQALSIVGEAGTPMTYFIEWEMMCHPGYGHAPQSARQHSVVSHPCHGHVPQSARQQSVVSHSCHGHVPQSARQQSVVSHPGYGHVP